MITTALATSTSLTLTATPADRQTARLAAIADAWTAYLHQCKQEGLHFIQPGRFVLPGDLAGAPALQFFPWPDVDGVGESKLAQADRHTNAGMLRERYNYYCEKVVKGFYKNVVGGRAGVTEYYMYDATNLRLREVSLSYSFPRKWVQKTNMVETRSRFWKDLRLFVKDRVCTSVPQDQRGFITLYMR